MATTVSEGTIRVHRSIGGTGAAFRVAFVPYGEGDDAKPAGERSFQQLQEVRVFLKVLGIGADYIKDVLRQLTAGRSAWVPNVSISEKVLRTAGFVSIGNFARIADGVNALREEMKIARESRFGPIEIVRLEIEKGLEATL